MMILEIILTLSIGAIAINLVLDKIKIKKQQKTILEFKRKLYSVDRDIKTLHFNQKVLQSSIKELHKDLRLYGEVKKSRIKSFNQAETREEAAGVV